MLRKFPVTNLCGQLFNDVLEGVSIIDKYLALGTEVSIRDKNEININLNSSYDTITIRLDPNDNKIKSVWYSANKELDKQEMESFIRINFRKKENTYSIHEVFEYGNINGYEIFVSIGDFGFLDDLSFGLQFLKS